MWAFLRDPLRRPFWAYVDSCADAAVLLARGCTFEKLSAEEYAYLFAQASPHSGRDS